MVRNELIQTLHQLFTNNTGSLAEESWADLLLQRNSDIVVNGEAEVLRLGSDTGNMGLHLYSSAKTKSIIPNAENLRIKTPSGYLDIGPANTSWCHFGTDRGQFHFGSVVHASGGFKVFDKAAGITGEGKLYAVNNAGTASNTVYIKDAAGYFTERAIPAVAWTNTQALNTTDNVIFNKIDATSGYSVRESSSASIYVASPGGGYFRTGTPTMTGAIKISLPVSWTSTMMTFTVEVFEYSSGKSFAYKISGYNYMHATSSYWVNSTVVPLAGEYRAFTVRFGHDGTKCCVYIGELTSTWSYPQIRVTNFVAGYNGDTPANWSQGWAIGFESTAFGTITAGATKTATLFGINQSLSTTADVSFGTVRPALFRQVATTVNSDAAQIVTSSVASNNGLYVETSGLSTGCGIKVTANALTTGRGIYAESSSTSASSRQLIVGKITGDSTSSTEGVRSAFYADISCATRSYRNVGFYALINAKTLAAATTSANYGFIASVTGSEVRNLAGSFQANDGVEVTQYNNTMDGFILKGATSGSSSRRVTLVPASLTANQSITFPNATGVITLNEATQTLTNKTLTSPAISGSPTISSTNTASNVLGITAASLTTASALSIQANSFANGNILYIGSNANNVSRPAGTWNTGLRIDRLGSYTAGGDPIIGIVSSVPATNSSGTNIAAFLEASSGGDNVALWVNSGSVRLNALTANSALALSAGKDIMTVTNSGSGNNVLATSPTLSGEVAISSGATAGNALSITADSLTTGSALVVSSSASATGGRDLAKITCVSHAGATLKTGLKISMSGSASENTGIEITAQDGTSPSGYGSKAVYVKSGDIYFLPGSRHGTAFGVRKLHHLGDKTPGNSSIGTWWYYAGVSPISRDEGFDYFNNKLGTSVGSVIAVNGAFTQSGTGITFFAIAAERISSGTIRLHCANSTSSVHCFDLINAPGAGSDSPIFNAVSLTI